MVVQNSFLVQFLTEGHLIAVNAVSQKMSVQNVLNFGVKVVIALIFLSFLENYNFDPIGHVLNTHFLGNPINSNLGSLRKKLHHHRFMPHKLHHFCTLTNGKITSQRREPPVFFFVCQTT